ncbi:hypothetical protein AKJ16_DCAP26627 [Drosera capensis]
MNELSVVRQSTRSSCSSAAADRNCCPTPSRECIDFILQTQRITTTHEFVQDCAGSSWRCFAWPGHGFLVVGLFGCGRLFCAI